MEDEEAQQQQDMSEETKKAAKLRKRDHVPTPLEVYYHDLAYKPLPALNIRTRDTVESMKRGAPWLLAEQEFGKAEKRSVIQDGVEQTSDGFSLDGLGNELHEWWLLIK